MTKLFEGARREWRYVAAFSAGALFFWLLEFAFQYFFYTPGALGISLIRSLGFTGASLISLALISGPWAQFFPKYSFVYHRRQLGVWGFTFLLLHISAVLFFLFPGTLPSLSPFDPFLDPLQFGILAALLFSFLYLTSTDWAVQKLGFKRWKALHRLAYPAYILAILHYLLNNPPVLLSPAGLLLLLLTLMALGFQLAAFVRFTLKRGAGLGTLVGILLILFALFLFYLAWPVLLQGLGGRP